MNPKKKKKEPPDPFTPAILMHTENCIHMISDCFVRAGLYLSSSVLVCSSLGRCSDFVSLQWLFRTRGILALKPSLAFVDDLLAQFGSVGVALGTSKVADSAICRYETPIQPCIWVHLHLYPSIAKIMALACFAVDGILVDLSSRYASPLFRLLVFRSELQVCYTLLFPSLFRVIHCHGLFLKASILKPSLFQFGFRFSNVLFPSCWEIIMLGYYQDKTCWILGQICAVLSIIIRMTSLLNFASCISLGLLLECFAAYYVHYEEYLAGYFDVNIRDSTWMFFLLLSYLVLLLIWFCFCVAKPLEFGFQSSQWANHVYLGLMLHVCSSTPFVQALSLRNSCVTFTEQHVSMCSMCRMSIRMVGHSSTGGWFILIMMTLSSSLTAMWVKQTLSWGLPSLWLSLFMVSPYAQMLGTLCSSICWHLAVLLNGWDEVKGQYPLVYEVVISEASFFVLRSLTFDTFRLVWYFDASTEHAIVYMISVQKAQLRYTAEYLKHVAA